MPLSENDLVTAIYAMDRAAPPDSRDETLMQWMRSRQALRDALRELVNPNPAGLPEVFTEGQ